MRQYVDSSVLVDRALAVVNAEGSLGMTSDTYSLVTSELTVVEVWRVLHRFGLDDALPRRVDLALSDVDLLSLGPTTLSVAARLPVRHLKSLDAIHVASALLTRCDVVLTRDHQMRRACEELGLGVA